MGTKISIELPEWAENRHIYIMAGTETLAIKRAFNDELWIKEERCNNCGKCCMDILHPEKFKFPTIDGNCAYLKIYEDGITSCTLGLDAVPFSCCTGDPVGSNWKDNSFCSIKYKKEKLEKS